MEVIELLNCNNNNSNNHVSANYEIIIDFNFEFAEGRSLLIKTL